MMEDNLGWKIFFDGICHFMEESTNYRTAQDLVFNLVFTPVLHFGQTLDLHTSWN